MKPLITANVESAYRQRGYNDGRWDRNTESGRSLAERVSPEALQAYLNGIRIGKQERERAEGKAP